VAGLPNSKGSRTAWRIFISCLVVIAMFATDLELSHHAAATGTPTITTDKADYAPEEVVTVTGTGFAAGTTYVVPVKRPNGSIVKGDGSFQPGADEVTSDGDGNFTYRYQLDGVTGTYEVRAYVSDGSAWSDSRWSETPVARMTFTDAAPSADIDDCQNGNPISPTACDASHSTDWTNGNITGSKGTYFEGDSIPFRAVITDVTVASHTYEFNWDTTKGGKHAFDYLTTTTCRCRQQTRAPVSPVAGRHRRSRSRTTRT